jgi:isocitrate/isopropylmalate dehydrogenase
MLDYLGHGEAAARIEQAVGEALRSGKTTADLGGDLTTSAVGDRIAAAVAG